MSGTAPAAAEGGCEERACLRAYGHRGDCVRRPCAKPGCENVARNAEERYCPVHEDRATYERYQAAR